jgi:L-asparaginase
MLIYTGGTIGMMKDPNTGELKPLKFDYIHQQIPEIQRLDVNVKPVSISNPIDSSQMQPAQWVELIDIIEERETEVDGFVILHGTDTMAYTASALSFMVQNLGKPIVITGSQLPVGVLRSDGKENLLAAIEIAGKKDSDGNSPLREVAVFFQSKLFRGNRVSKVSAHQFDAFDSPNYPLLGFAGVEIEIDPTQGVANTMSRKVFYRNLDLRVGLLKLYPGINLRAYSSVFRVENHRAVVIEAFGSGNTPNDESFAEILSSYVLQDGIIAYVTQCTRGSVLPRKYASGHLMIELGAWNGKNLTTEAALTKMMWILGKHETVTQSMFEEVVCGESD